MPLMHGIRLLLTELNGASALHNLLCDNAASLRGLGKKERVISMDVLAISEPSEAAIRFKLPHAAFDMGSEGLPGNACVLPGPMIRRDQNLDVLRVRVPGGPSLCINQIGESDLASGLDVDLIVRKEIRLLGLEALGPMNLVVAQRAVTVEGKPLMGRHLPMTVHAEYCCSEQHYPCSTNRHSPHLSLGASNYLTHSD